MSETEKKKTWYVIMCNINSVVTVLYYILSNVQQTKTIFFSDRNFVTVLILILRKSSAYLHNHSISSFKFLKNKLVTTKIFKEYELKFIHSKTATKFCEIFPLLLTVCTVVKSKGKISQNFVAFSEYMNFIQD